MKLVDHSEQQPPDPIPPVFEWRINILSKSGYRYIALTESISFTQAISQSSAHITHLNVDRLDLNIPN
jgi:hypothetical protein